MREISEGRAYSERVFVELKGKLGFSSTALENKACVYAFGSYGRKEATDNSDLDLAIVGRNDGKKRDDGIEGSRLSRVDEIRVKADIIQAAESMGIGKFDADGRFFIHFSIDEFTKLLGGPADDYRNTLTARVLLLLESQPLLGVEVYNQTKQNIIDVYWREFPRNSHKFVPGYFANDVLRLWRTFCVNYEAGLNPNCAESRARAKVKNYTLKHSRMLTCFSGLLYLLAVFRQNNTVTAQDAIEMSNMTPTERLEWLLAQAPFHDCHADVNKTLMLYERFLANKKRGNDELKSIFVEKDLRQPFVDDSTAFGEALFNVVSSVGGASRLHRMLLI